MKRSIGLILAIALAAGPAAAQGTFGSKPKQTWSPGSTIGAPKQPETPKPYGGSSGYGAPSAPAAPQSRFQGQQRIYGAPEPPKADGFTPYKPFTAGSTYASPYGSNKAKGAKDCERSSYAKACER